MKRQSRARLWAARLRQFKKIWAQLSPHGTLSRGSSSGGQVGFSSVEEIAEGIRFHAMISATEIDEKLAAIGDNVGIPFGAAVPGLRIDDVSVRVHGGLNDDRVTERWRSVEDTDVGALPFLDFDVHAAESILERRQLTQWPHVSLDASDDEIARVLQRYCNMIDRLWDHVGGRNRAGFQALALWVMEKDRAAGLHGNALGCAFAAFLYGDRDRARKVLADYESGWDQRARDEPDRPLVAQVRARALEAAARARDVIG
jgi:hypothetical protein